MNRRDSGLFAFKYGRDLQGFLIQAIQPLQEGFIMKRSYVFKTNFVFGDVFAQLLKWTFLSVVTFGVALFFFPYYFAQFMLTNTTVICHESTEEKLSS